MWGCATPARARVRREINLRILVAADETVGAVLLAGDKTGSWRERYELAVLTADALYDDHLRRQRP